ncbi:hypothetical protein BKA70DRAFT_1559510 [Coprinopsis sp. MPI-PUGE-AT-0042]|nr:hypothetical protein BKA70DRAFT_1559510 [Coprinopsis sp. MPI-PUGE-AT-0042]
MFSSLSQYLPSALQNTIAAPLAPQQPESQELPPQSNFDPTTDDEGDEDGLLERAGREQDKRLENDDDADDDRRKPKSKKEKMANETLIFVRPPPSKSNHPLNLQVQLVPPNGRAPSGIAPVPDTPVTPTSASSVGTMSSEGGRSAVSVSRSMSTRSTDSNYSTNHSSNSTTSFSSMTTDASGASSATSSSGRNPRRIIPLYNLQAHNVLTNTIVDAGTDAKIARFQKRGLELIDLAVLEPVEVWGVRSKEARREGMMISVDEMGTIVHSPTFNRGSLPSSRNLLQPNPPRQSSRPGTPSGNSSAVSLHTNSTHVSHTRPQLLISPPRDPPASAPPISGTFPTSQLPNVTSPETDPTSPEFTSPQSMAPKKSGLFGKLKFNSKRASIISPATSPIAEVPSQPASPLNPAIKQEPSDFADFGMAPLAPGDLNQRPVTTGQAKPTTSTKPAAAPSPLILSPPNSPTPTSSPVTPKAGEGSKDCSEPVSPAATLAPTRSGSINHGRNLSLTGALSRGKKLIGGTKPPSNPDTPDQSSPPAVGGARGFFNKLATGITGNQNNSNAAPEPSGSSLFPTRPKPSRTSMDSSTTNGSGMSNIKNKFDRILQNSSSQQFAGNGGTGTPRVSVDSQRPSTGISTLAQPLQASNSQSQLQGVNPGPGGSQAHVTLRQLQLRPPVLGLQPTYVSASMPTSIAQQQPSTVSLNSQAQPPTDEQANQFLREIESKTSLATTEGTTEESFPSSAISKRRPGSRSTSARNSLNLDRDSLVLTTPTTNTNGSSIPPPVSGTSQVPVVSGKEKALMYVWLVRKWLKKRNGGGGGPGFSIPFGHSHGASESKSGGLFSNLVNRERREASEGGAGAGKRGSWHAGAGIGISSLAALGSGSHSHQPSTSGGGGGGGFVLSPIVGGGIEVRFEWKRAKAKKEKKSKRKDKEKGDKTKDGKGKLPELKARDMAREKTETPETRTVPLPDTDDTPRPGDVPVLAGRGLVDSPRKMADGERGRRYARGSVASLSSTQNGFSRSSSMKSRKSEASPGGNLGMADASVKSKRRLSLRLKGLDRDDEDGEDDGEESDAEDSETPWVCTLKIRKLVAGGMGVSSGGDASLLSPPNTSASASGSLENVDAQEKEQIVRLKVGTLSQTPHHPKVVAMLKIPFPLPDVEVERMEVVPRKPAGISGGGTSAQPSTTSFSSAGSDQEAYKGLVMTAEEIKDVVCSTGLWLAVREGFGGVGKVNRKGDGWKIRG